RGRVGPEGRRLERIRLADGRVVVAAVSTADRLLDTIACVAGTCAEHVDALEILVPPGDGARAELPEGSLENALAAGLTADGFTVSLLSPGGDHEHVTVERSLEGTAIARPDHQGLHPEVAARIGLARLASFRLERIRVPEGVYAFHGRSVEAEGDERIFVLAEVRRGVSESGPEAALQVAAFVQVFHEAVRTLRAVLLSRDPGRRLQWNRITISVEPEIFLDPVTVRSLARRLAPSTRHLGLEKIVVRLRLFESEGRPPRPVEVVFSDSSGGVMEIAWRTPHGAPLRAANDYERRVAEARRRGLVYPYEIVRMLTDSPEGAAVGSRTPLPRGTFEEHD
ncbi:MAG: hypothetical protein ACREQ9_17275, partial [Candidatus Binatia bacterium]